MSLQEQLQQQKAQTAQKASPEILATMGKATTDLKASGIENRALGVGDEAPGFSLPNAHGKQVSLSSLLANGPVVLNIYRGGWCPYCNLELKALAAELPSIRAAGAQLVAIAPEKPEKALETSERHALEFEVLSDSGNRVSRQFGLVFTLPEAIREIYTAFGIDVPAFNGDETFELPLPATYVIDRNGVIVHAFVDADYTQRLEPSEIVEVVERL